MKYAGWKILRAMLFSTLVVVMAFVGTMNIGTEVKAAKTTEATDVVKYVEFNGDIAPYLNNHTAPEYTGDDINGFGYLFGGWYYMNETGDTKEYDAITKSEDLSHEKGTLVAKFVPSQTLSVKCQNWAGTVEGSDDVIVRVISATDSTNYSQFGFIVSRIENGTETVLTQEPFITKTTYSTFNYYESQEDTEPDTYVPSDLFGQAATRFTTCTIGKIPASAHGTIICITPFWDTLDGTRVYGLNKFAHVEDGYLHYVNVPVNLNILNSGNGAMAGSLSVTTDDGLTFLGVTEGVEYGKVFDEMEFNVSTDAQDNTIIKCVGVSSDVSDKQERDIYVNLKFQRSTEGESPIANNFYTFTVSDEQFCDSKEHILEKSDVWNIIY